MKYGGLSESSIHGAHIAPCIHPSIVIDTYSNKAIDTSGKRNIHDPTSSSAISNDSGHLIEICAFSGAKIYPGKGKIYVRVDNRSFRFVNGKAESLFLQRKNPRKISWTVLFRRMHKKGIAEEVTKKRTRRTVKHQRAVVGASWEAIRAKRNQKPEVRAAARAAALRDGKEKKKAENATKKAEKAKNASAAARGQPKVSKQAAKGAKVAIANTSR
ncbi:60S ribosomal protein L24 [Linnemannia zychae]|nr:60S ribosomal protein L24 [Linnemannia zychae]